MFKIKFKSIQSNIMLSILGVVILMLMITSVLSYRFTKEAVEDNSIEYTYRLIELVDKNIEYYLKDMNNMANAIIYNYDVTEYFGNSKLYANKRKALKDKIKLEINGMLENRYDISTISLFGHQGQYILSSDKQFNEYSDIYNQEWFEQALHSDGQSVLSSSHVQNINKGEYPWVVSLSREILGIKEKNSIGVLVIDLNYTIINEICNDIKLGDSGYIYIVDEFGELVYHPDQRLINSGLKSEIIDEIIVVDDTSFTINNGNTEKIYTVKTSSYSGWKIVGVRYSDELVTNVDKMSLYYTVLSVIALIVAIVVSSWISLTISKPIKQLKQSMQDVRYKNLDSEIVIDTSNEIGDLSHTFNSMTKEIKMLIDQNTVEQNMKRKSELKALQAQINPHFLYNTLDSIIWMSIENKNQEVIEMTSALAKMLRLSISKGDELVTLKNEMNHVRNYLIIQKYRYGDKLDYEIKCDEVIAECKVLKIMLQPIVENSIYHGIKNKLDDGVIKIHATKEDNYIVIKVIDDGVGMTPDTLSNIFSLKLDSNNGVGIANVNERIKLYFGEQYGIEFESEIEVGTIATIRIPLEY